VWLSADRETPSSRRSAGGRVFDRTVDLDGYRAMNEREALKVLIRP
jgi:hypothetical protein